MLLRRLGGQPVLQHAMTGHDIVTELRLPKFNLMAPGAQAVIDLLQGRWTSDIGQVIPGVVSGTTGLFADPRVGFAVKTFAGAEGDLRGQRVLELGPLEAAHTFQLERLGAEVVAVESNTEAFLKCLIVKELTRLHRAQFLYGDFVQYLRSTNGERFDLIFCCGVLYHLPDPLDLIEAMAARTRRVFVWTHYQGEARKTGTVAESVGRGGERYTYYRRQNVDRRSPGYWGGGQASSTLMPRNDILRAFERHGFTHSDIHHEEPDHPGGPCFSASFWRE